jgi:hypothetical protein
MRDSKYLSIIDMNQNNSGNFLPALQKSIVLTFYGQIKQAKTPMKNEVQ